MLLRFIKFLLSSSAARRIRRTKLYQKFRFWRQFFKLRREGVPVLTLRMAARRGIKDIWHLNKGVGDALMFSGVAREYYKIKGERPLLFVPQHQVFRYCDFCWFLFDFRFQNVPGAANSFEAFYKFYHEQRMGKSLRLATGYRFRLQPLEYLKSVYVVGNTFDKLYGGFPKCGQIVQWIANRMGVVGEIDVKPEIRLTQFEKDFGKFATGKIVIKTGGNTPYKYLNHKIAQGLVNRLRHKYDFLQIGDFGDPVIDGAENLFRLNMREFAGVLHNARLFIGAIGGMMHLARAVDCPSIILHGCEHDDFYYSSHKKVFSENRCFLCRDNCWWPDKDDEHRCPNGYRCMTDFDIDKVAVLTIGELTKPRERAATPDKVKCVGRMVDCNTATNWWLTFDDFFLDYSIPTAADEITVYNQTIVSRYHIKKNKKYKIYSLWDSKVFFDVINNLSLNYQKEIYSDNPFIIRLKPQPSIFSYLAKAVDMQPRWTNGWFKRDVFDDSEYWAGKSCAKPEYATLEGFVRANHLMNFYIYQAYAFDGTIESRYNKLRNLFIERIDETLMMIMAPRLPKAFMAPPATETLGSIIDRLSQLSLQIYNAQGEFKMILQEQRIELLEAVKLLLVEFINGSKRPRIHKQFKMP